MSEHNLIMQRATLQNALKNFANKSLAQAGSDLLGTLGYSSTKTVDLGVTVEEFISNIESFTPNQLVIDRNTLLANQWKSCAFLFQLTNEEIPLLAIGQASLTTDHQFIRNQIESFSFLAIELTGESYTRTQLTTITRNLNKIFPMPAILLFRYGDFLSLAVVDRRQHLRDNHREVLDSRITVIKDVKLSQPHRAHLDILLRLNLKNLGERNRPSNFRQLYDAWIETLSTQKLNEAFYKELAWWYMWAVKEVEFPQGGGEEADKRNAIGVIRLLTRLIFVWFIKERGLVPQALFERETLKTLLKEAPDSAPESSNYYQAILQNLFFATLNQEMGNERRWAQTGSGQKKDYLIGLVYRYQEDFLQPETVIQNYFAQVPFLNGGLFECLDEQLSEQDLARRPDLAKLAVKEGNQWVLRIDGFSRRPEARAKVPNKLFFEGIADAELNSEFDTKNKRYPVRGLIDLLNSYKFTVDENTPLDEEVALDPELLGKVFENLLASYNADTRNTARKQSGSFYTPREVVDYMVDEALIAYFTRHLTNGEQREAELRQLLSHANNPHSFSTEEASLLVSAIENLKVLDPACGSGAFPMGMLAKLFTALKKLDPDNQNWRAQNLAPLQQRLALAKKTPDPLLRDNEIEDAEAALEKHKQDFADPSYADYTRKLYLIEKCIFGSDIQPIAVQISKLRFFISLIVSQPINRDKPNWNITPLPNLETKIVAANTLFGVPRHGVQGSLLNDLEITEKENELREANAAYFTSRTRATKLRRKERVQKLHEELVSLLQRDGFVTSEDAERMARWNPFNQNDFADFFDVEWMFGMPRACDNTESVFDIVIGNPPYVRQEEIKHLKPLLKENYKYKCYTGTADLFVYFYERSVNLLKPHGALSFITSNKWYRAKYGENLRQFMVTHTKLKNIIDFGDEAVFTAIAYPTIVIATRRENHLKAITDSDTLRALNWQQTHPVEDFPIVFQKESFEIPQTELKKQGWQLETPKKRKLLAHLRAAGQPLGDYVNGRLYRGVLTGLNEAFVINSVTRARLIAEDPHSAEIIKPYLRGRDIKRWRLEPQDLWLIFTRRPFEIENYPAIKKHLSQFKQQLMPKPKNWNDKDSIWPGRKAGNYEWYEIQDNIAYWQEFEQPKIILGRFMDKPTYVFDENCYFTNDAVYIIAGANRFIVAILNSSISWWFLRSTCTDLQNGFIQAYVRNQEPIPIPLATEKQQRYITSITHIIESSIQSSNQFERLINGLVFELFFPTELHAANIHLFEACEAAGVGKLTDLHGEELVEAAKVLANTIFATNHPIYAMLFDLQALDVVRTIEGTA